MGHSRFSQASSFEHKWGKSTDIHESFPPLSLPFACVNGGSFLVSDGKEFSVKGQRTKHSHKHLS